MLCYAIEGSLRLKYHVGSLTAIERRTSDRRLRAKAIVMRQNVIDIMMGDPIYIGYLCVVFFGAPVAMVAVLVHHVRLDSAADGLDRVSHMLFSGTHSRPL